MGIYFNLILFWTPTHQRALSKVITKNIVNTISSGPYDCMQLGSSLNIYQDLLNYISPGFKTILKHIFSSAIQDFFWLSWDVWETM